MEIPEMAHYILTEGHRPVVIIPHQLVDALEPEVSAESTPNPQPRQDTA